MGISGVIIAVLATGVIITTTEKIAEVAKIRIKGKNDIKLQDNIHVLEMRMQDLEVELREAKENILLLKEKKYEEIDK